MGPGNLAQVLELVQVVLDEYLAHVATVEQSAAMYSKTKNLARSLAGTRGLLGKARGSAYERSNGQRSNPTTPEMMTRTGSENLKRHRITKLTRPMMAVGRSTIARAPSTTTAPVMAPVAAAVAPSTNALSCRLSRWRLNHGAGGQ